MNLTPNFTLEDLTRSDYATRHDIDNAPSPEVTERLTLLCDNCLEPVLAYVYPRPVVITSGYRCPELNTAIGGAKFSQHVLGEAVDFTVSGLPVQNLFDWIREQSLFPFDQVIQEFDRWVHLSFRKENNRAQALYAIKDANKKTKYLTPEEFDARAHDQKPHPST